MSNCHHLSFSVGPVQAFVAQSRRTRDLWCGSWLLSYLSESALVGVERRFETAISIIPDRSRTRGELSSINRAFGGIPNRFELKFDSRQEAVAAGNVAREAFDLAWHSIASQVHSLVEPAFRQGYHSQEIWDRQVNHFWELSWIVAQPANGASTLSAQAAARKLFRNVSANEEAGDKCFLMPELQELSGYDRSEAQNDFWDAIRGCREIGELDIGEGERLSAIALIKRLFPKVDERILGRSLEKKYWPSTAFLAALPWISEIDRNPDPRVLESARIYANEPYDSGQSELNTGGIRHRISLSEKAAANEAAVGWASIDGQAWFESAILNNDWGITADEQAQRLKDLRELYRMSEGKKPAPFYALLLMDGDSMGELLSALGGDPARLSECLGRFAESVDEVIAAEPFRGRTVYAGGDDVMAMLPAIGALPAAAALEAKYRESFLLETGQRASNATISAAIVYAHWKQPLRQVIELAHHLLDDVAKNRTGRDSLAVGVMKRSGLNALWSSPWPNVRDRKLIELNDSIIHCFAKNELTSPSPGESVPNFNASFLYHLRHQYSRLTGKSLDQPGSFVSLNTVVDGEAEIFLDLAHAEFRRRLSMDQAKALDVDTTREHVRALMELSYCAYRRNKLPELNRNSFGFDGWRLARFLKQIFDGEVIGDE